MLIYENPEAAFRRLRATGRATLPMGRVESRMAAQAMVGQVADRGAFDDDIRRYSEGRRRLNQGVSFLFREGSLAAGNPGQIEGIKDMAMRRTAATAFSDAQLAWPKMRDPFDAWKEKAWWWLDQDLDKSLSKIRAWCRLLYMTHHLVPSLIDIYSRFPLLDIEFFHHDKRVASFFNELFLEQLDYQDFLFKMNREYWLVGEAFPLGSWHDGIGAWESDQLINPDDVVISKHPALSRYEYHLKVPDTIKELIERKEPVEEYNVLVRDYPYLITWASQDIDIPVSSVLMKHLKFDVDPWNPRGVPILLRAFRTLMMEESLNAAQDAIADRLYSPLILARLGLDNVDDEGPWIPDPEELSALRNDLSLALNSDFRLMVYHHGLDIQSVFGREQMPRLDADFDRIDKRLMQIFGIGRELIEGGSANVPYAAGALNRELVTNLLESSQVQVRRFLRERMEVVADAQGIYEYEKVGDQMKPVMERVLIRNDETGEEYIQERPKLAIPEVHFRSVSIRDEKAEREFLLALESSGVPVSARAKMVNVPFVFEDELKQKQREKLETVLAELEYKRELFERIRRSQEEGNPLPIPAEYQQEYEAWLSGRTGVTGSDTDDISDKAPAPSLLDDGQSVGTGSSSETTKERTRPEESDEQREDMPKASSLQYPDVETRTHDEYRDLGLGKRQSVRKVAVIVDGMRVKVEDDADEVARLLGG